MFLVEQNVQTFSAFNQNEPKILKPVYHLFSANHMLTDPASSNRIGRK